MYLNDQANKYNQIINQLNLTAINTIAIAGWSLNLIQVSGNLHPIWIEITRYFL